MNTLNSFLIQNCKLHGDKSFILSSKHIYTYKDVEEKTRAIGKGLLAIGIKHKTHVAVLADNTYESILLMMSLLRIGAICVMLGPFADSAQLLERLNYADCTYLAYSANIRFVNIKSQIHNLKLANIKERIEISNENLDNAVTLYSLIVSGQSISDNEFNESAAKVMNTDYDLMLFTSGSTGNPKGVMHSFDVRAKAAYAQISAMDVKHNDVFCVALPFYHCFGIVANVVCAILSGAALAFPDGHHTKDILECIQNYSCTILNGVPTLFNAIKLNENFDQYKLDSLRTGIIAGAKYSEHFFVEMCEAFSAEFISSYGMTETCTGICSSGVNEPRSIRAKTVGEVSPGLEVKIVDSEILVRGFSVMESYYKCEIQTKDAIDDNGWLHTGDCGVFEDDHLIINGRIKDIIIKSGENIIPFEIENVINSMLGVEVAKIVGLPDRFWGEIICAVVKTHKNIAKQEILEYCKARLLKNKVPDKIVFVDNFPMTQSGKIDLVRIKQIANE